MMEAVNAVVGRALDIRQQLSALLELTKPRLTSLVLVTTAAGFWIGLRSLQRLDTLVWLLLGTALAAGGANALNQVIEREPDALMHRTRTRPLPSGRLEVEAARRFGVTLAVTGVGLLAVAVNGLTGLLAAVCALTYLFAYTPLKRMTSLCTLVGAIPGAIPPMMGWTAAGHQLGPQAWALFGVLFVWQLPHFLAIAVLYRDDYARAGFKMLPLIESGGAVSFRQIVLYGLVLVPVSLVPTMTGMAGEGYFYGALGLSVVFLAFCVRSAWRRSLHAARQLFLASIVYLPLLLALLAWDKRPGVMG